MEQQYYYNEIMSLYGLDDMKTVIKKWQNVSKHLKSANELPIVLPNLLWLTKPGVGKSHFINLLSEYLSAAKLMSFYGTVKCLEFSLDYCPDEQDFSELRRLMRELEAATSYRGVFKGVLSVELNQWIGHFESLHFKRLMNYLASMDNKLCILFVLENVSDASTVELERILAQYVRIEKIVTPYPSVDDFMGFIVTWLQRYDFSLMDDAKALLKDSVAFLRSSDHFDGFKTLILMCEDIVFEICASDTLNDARIITSGDLTAYAQDGVFINRLKENMQKRVIGFQVENGGAQ